MNKKKEKIEEINSRLNGTEEQISEQKDQWKLLKQNNQKKKRESRRQLQEKNCKNTHMEAKQCALNNQWVTEEINKEIFKYLETNDMKTK